MELSILELVLTQLQAAGFTASAAYPGQLSPQILDTIAAVHIEKVDGTDMTVTVEVNICCPASLGGTQAELQALRAAEVLNQAGAECIQHSCAYDGAARAYIVPVKAVFSGAAKEDGLVSGLDFEVVMNEELLPYVVSFQAKYDTGNDVYFRNGEVTSLESSRITGYWIVTMEERIPNGISEVPSNDDRLDLVVNRGNISETYRNCLWTDLQRKYTREGLVRIREAIAEERVETVL